MFEEAMDAGYMARSAEQTHRDDGSWGSYDYVVGMPEDVEKAIAKSRVAFSPQRPGAHARQACALKEAANHKEKSQKSLSLENPLLLPRRRRARLAETSTATTGRLHVPRAASSHGLIPNPTPLGLNIDNPSASLYIRRLTRR
jgi:hypothetical protein